MASRARARSSDCSERSPPCAVFWWLKEIPLPKSSASIKAVLKPRLAASYAIVSPWIPPPTTRRSNALDSSRLTSRGCMVELLLYSKDLVPSSGSSSTADVRTYWNHHIHDLEITTHAMGTPGFFSDLDQYHFEKLHHLLRLVDFNGWRGKRVLEVGCGAGTDLARFARGGAIVTGVDLAASAIELARKNFEQQGLQGDFREADGEHLPRSEEHTSELQSLAYLVCRLLL